jgi:uncharacterized protein YecT (DUF1311 family)
MILLSLLLFVQAARATTAAYESDNPSAADGRPYTLCLAETDFDREEAKLDRQLKLTLARVRSRLGLVAERRLRHEQSAWVWARDRKCEATAAATPVTQEARNEMACRSILTVERTKHLKRIARAR